MVFAAKRYGGVKSIITLYHHTYLCGSFLIRKTFSHKFAASVVAAVDRCTGDYKIAYSGKSAESSAAAAHGNAHPRHFGNTSCNEHCGGVVAAAHSSQHACGKGDYVFKCAAQFYAVYVGISIYPHT